MTLILPDPRLESPELLYPGRKPTGSVVVDWSHPLTRKLKRMYMPQRTDTVLAAAGGSNGRMHDYAQNKASNLEVAYGSGATLEYDAELGVNVTLGFDGSSSAYVDPIGDTGQNATILLLCKFNAWNGGGNVVFGHTDFGDNHRIYIGHKNTSGALASVRLGGMTSTHTPTVNFEIGKLHSYGVSWQTDAAKTEVWLDGTLRSTFNRGTSEPGSSANSTGFGYTLNTSNIADAVSVGAVFIWYRQLSPAEMLSMKVNPYQFLIPA